MRRLKGKRGYVFIATAALAAVMLAFVGLAMDVGYLEWQRLRVQTAADSAAVGGVLELKRGSNDATVTSAGQADSALNGYTNGAANTTVAVNHPPVRGSFAGSSAAVEAVVTRSVPTYFMSVLGQKQAQISARAVAMLGSKPNSSCVYALSPTASRAFQINGSNSTSFTCGLDVCSSSSTALHMEGSGTLTLKNGSGVGLVGGLDLTGQTRIVDSSGSNITPSKITCPGDPLAGVAAPTTAGLTLRGSSNTYYDMNRKPAGNTIQPGIYCGGLSIGNTGGVPFTMAPGVYYIAGGGFIANSQAIVRGTGVTIYNSSGPNSGVAGCNSSFAPFNFDGQAQLTLSAPTSGPLEGMLIMQDRSITSTSINNIQGGATTNLTGSIYLLHSPLQFTGNNTSGGYTILVADTIIISGNSTLTNDYSSLQDGSPIKDTAVLAE